MMLLGHDFSHSMTEMLMNHTVVNEYIEYS